jgi:hypothetical protein
MVWWEADGIEPLARRDRVYSAATAPACPYLRFPNRCIWLQKGARLFISVAYSRYIRGLQNITLNWRKREVLIPNGNAIRLVSSERRTLVRLRFQSGGRLSARCSYAVAHQSLSRRCRHPGRLAFHYGGAVRCRSPHVAVPRVFETRCRAVGDRSELRSFGVPSEIRTPDLPLRRRMLYSNELRERSERLSNSFRQPLSAPRSAKFSVNLEGNDAH